MSTSVRQMGSMENDFQGLISTIMAWNDHTAERPQASQFYDI